MGEETVKMRAHMNGKNFNLYDRSMIIGGSHLKENELAVSTLTSHIKRKRLKGFDFEIVCILTVTPGNGRN